MQRQSNTSSLPPQQTERLRHMQNRQRNDIRAKAPTLKTNSVFVIKTLRADKWCYIRDFVETITPPFKKKPLRKGKKRPFTVTSKGIYARTKKDTHIEVDRAIPQKERQYQPEEKAGFSKFQSASLAFRYNAVQTWFGVPRFIEQNTHYPQPFEWQKTTSSAKKKLVGVMIDEQNYLYSDRLFTHAEGTVSRPYDYATLAHTKPHNRNEMKIYNQANLNSLIQDIISFERSHRLRSPNEVLVRMRWCKDEHDKTSSFFIASDNLESRLWAQEYVRLLKERLSKVKDRSPTQDDTIRIYYYFPHDPALHMNDLAPTSRTPY